MAYLAFVLDEESRTRVLKYFTTKFSDVIAHHVTIRFGINSTDSKNLIAGWNIVCEQGVLVVGYTCSDTIEAAIVQIGPSIQRTYDDSLYHITLSLDKSRGAKPVDSNKIIKTKGWRTILDPFPITGIIKIIE